MRKYTCLSFLILLINFFNCDVSRGQTTLSDSSSQQNALNNAVSVFHASLGNQSPLYNGPEYYYYDPTIKGNPYFMEVKTFTAGSVFYDGQLYTNVPMVYDLYLDRVALLHFNHYSKFALLPGKLKSFDFLDHHFVYINADEIGTNTAGIKTGNYDLLYKGKLQVLVKRSKSIQTTSGTSTVETYFTPAIDYYLKKDNAYYSFSSQGSLLDILKDHKKELQQYIKSSQLKYKEAPEEAMVKIVSYYDHLSN